MKPVSVLISIAVMIGAPLSAAAALRCDVGEAFILPNMPMLRDQMAPHLCFAMAAATAIDYRICQATQDPDCSKGTNAVSVLDLIKQGFGGEKFEYQSSYNLLLNVDQKSLVRESCEPYSRLSNPGDESFPRAKETFEQIRTASKAALAHRPLSPDQTKALTLLARRNQLSFPDALNRLSQLPYEKFNNSFSDARACAEAPLVVQSKPLTLWNRDVQFGSPVLFDFIEAKLKEQRPVIWRLCASVHAEKICTVDDAHFAVIFGFRKQTCVSAKGQPVVKTEWLVRDSSRDIGPLTGQGKTPGDYWVSEEFFRERTTAVLNDDARGGYLAGNILWIQGDQ